MGETAGGEGHRHVEGPVANGGHLHECALFGMPGLWSSVGGEVDSGAMCISLSGCSCCHHCCRLKHLKTTRTTWLMSELLGAAPLPCSQAW